MRNPWGFSKSISKNVVTEAFLSGLNRYFTKVTEWWSIS